MVVFVARVMVSSHRRCRSTVGRSMYRHEGGQLVERNILHAPAHVDVLHQTGFDRETSPMTMPSGVRASRSTSFRYLLSTPFEEVRMHLCWGDDLESGVLLWVVPLARKLERDALGIVVDGKGAPLQLRHRVRQPSRAAAELTKDRALASPAAWWSGLLVLLLLGVGVVARHRLDQQAELPSGSSQQQRCQSAAEPDAQRLQIRSRQTYWIILLPEPPRQQEGLLRQPGVKL